MRSPSLVLVETTVSLIFLPRVPEILPQAESCRRTPLFSRECCRQPPPRCIDPLSLSESFYRL